MSGEIYVPIIGNIGKGGVELRFTPSGDPVCKFSLASTARKLDRSSNEWKDQEPTWINVTAWRSLAENIAGSDLGQGDRVIVYGTLRNRAYEDKDGTKRTSLDLEALAVGPDLAWVTARLGDGVHQGAKPRRQRSDSADSGTADDPWAGASKQRPEGTQTATPSAETQRAAQAAGDEDPPW